MEHVSGWVHKLAWNFPGTPIRIEIDILRTGEGYTNSIEECLRVCLLT